MTTATAFPTNDLTSSSKWLDDTYRMHFERCVTRRFAWCKRCEQLEEDALDAAEREIDGERARLAGRAG